MIEQHLASGARGLALFVGRYVLVAGLAYAVVHVLCARRLAGRKLDPRTAGWRQVRLELLASIASGGVFAAIIQLLQLADRLGHTRTYRDFDRHGWGWFALSLLLLLALHDAWFYWTHRLMHTRAAWFTHRFHHRFHTPTPWAGFALHPLEALIQAGVLVPAVFLIPLHAYALFAFVSTVIAVATITHLGYELYPAWLRRSTLGSWLMTATDHSAHHRGARGNFGLYTKLWDVACGTYVPADEHDDQSSRI